MARSGSQAAWDPWTYRREAGVTGDRGDLVGFDIEATDGHIGKIDEASDDVGSRYVVVDTGPWIFHRSKDEIKNAPKFDKDTYRDPAYRDRLGEYYGKFRY